MVNFENLYHEIYSAELEMKKENQENTSPTFLNLSLHISIIGIFFQYFLIKEMNPLD